MNGAQPRRDGGAVGGDQPRSQGPLLPDHVRQVAAPHVIHDQAEGLALGDHVPQAHDVGAVHPLEGVALLEEGVNDIALPGELGAQLLEGEGLLRSLLVPLPHIALRTRSNALLKNVARTQTLHGNLGMKDGRDPGSPRRKGAPPSGLCHTRAAARLLGPLRPGDHTRRRRKGDVHHRPAPRVRPANRASHRAAGAGPGGARGRGRAVGWWVRTTRGGSRSPAPRRRKRGPPAERARGRLRAFSGRPAPGRRRRRRQLPLLRSSRLGTLSESPWSWKSPKPMAALSEPERLSVRVTTIVRRSLS